MEKTSFSVLVLPVLEAGRVELRWRQAARQGGWRQALMAGPWEGAWWSIDLRELQLADGAYEYEFVISRGNTRQPVPDPYAEELSALGPIRAVLHIRDGERVRPTFSWDEELPASGRLPDNNELVIYERPMRLGPLNGLAPLHPVAIEHLDEAVARSHVNCIQMLPIQDSPDTLNGGYGTRFFFAPDRGIATPLALRAFIKRCHRRGIRVIMDLVMNHARDCPLRELAFDWFFLRDGKEEPDANGNPRPAWGGDIFRYRTERGGRFHARELQYEVARFFITEYHIDGFRLDEFKGIDNYEFIQTLTERAHNAHHRIFGGKRPFIVIAEDSARRAEVTNRHAYRGRRVADAIWDFDFRDEVRQVASNSIPAEPGDSARSDRVRRLLTVGRCELFGPHRRTSRLFGDMTNRVAYCTSHDIPAGEEQRLMPYYAGQAGDREAATRMVHSTFALMLSAAGIPMFLAGEEADCGSHAPGGICLEQRIRDLIRTRVTHQALHRNELEFFGFSVGTANAGFHPRFDAADGERLFAYCRTGGMPLGVSGQVIVVANCGPTDYPEVDLDWPWGCEPEILEVGGEGSDLPVVSGYRARLALPPFAVRMFTV